MCKLIIIMLTIKLLVKNIKFNIEFNITLNSTFNIKSNYYHYLPLGSQLSVYKIDGDWAEIFLHQGHSCKIGFVPKKHLINVKDTIEDWVNIAECLIGTPYKWGGRDSLGLDCSALLQLSYQTYGQNIPRNTIDQVLINKKDVTDINRLERGFVVFWKGHVGIMTDDVNCVHANAFHMKTIKEPLKDIINRMGKNSLVIKIVNFNN